MGFNLTILRQAGFFKEYENLSEEELLNTLHDRRRKEYSTIFGYNYEPEQIKDDHRLALQDDKKFLDIDLESDVGAGNKVYSSLLEDFARASNGYFSPSAIEESWKSDGGPIRVSFLSNNSKIVFEPEYLDDWIDARLFEIINQEMCKVTKEKFYLCVGPNEEWLGQNVIYIRLNEGEKNLLEEKLNWKFFEE